MQIVCRHEAVNLVLDTRVYEASRSIGIGFRENDEKLC